MKCCGACFADQQLAAGIEHVSSEKGNCESCKAQNVSLVDANILADAFELVCGIYEEHKDGRKLVDWLIEDWKLFAVDRPQAMVLLTDILDDAERGVRRTYRPSAMCASDSLDVWEKLRHELRTRNRFFPDTEFDTKRVADLLTHLCMSANDIPQTWYRARIQDGSDPFSLDQMGPPPANKAGPGRANPVGIPYLYVGSEQDTAVTEVRPHPGEILTIAEFTIENDVQLIDLRNPREMITPFVMPDIKEVASMRGDIDFLEQLGQELTTPVLPNAAAVDYIPSQYFCEFIKGVGYDGVVYTSSVSDGINLALFQPEKATVGTISRVKIDSVGVTFKSYT